jgi:hypothetical protein
MTDKPKYDEFDPDSICCRLEANAQGNVLYTNFAGPEVRVVPNAAIMVAAVFHRLTNDPAFNDEMMRYAEDNMNARKATPQ